ncbi:MAG TPA: DsbC family protein [Janthinobacterium sp.]|jgi:thiol:disulfide interchange protein DsbC|nr:DsbC family protein [Janthinobacterium sp.]
MKKNKILLLLLSLLAIGRADADPQTEANIKKIIEQRLGANTKVESIRETPYSGLYELHIDGEILYTDKLAQYLINGHVFNTRNMQDLTKERLEDINKIKFSDLPLDMAVKMVKGDGKRVIAVFEDPNCGWCKRFRKDTLKDVDNVTVYTFMYNILAEDSSTKSKNVWCAPDRAKAWDDWMVRGIAAPAAPASCATPNDKVLALGQKLRITGTPSMFFTDGSRIPGAIDAKGLEAKLASIKQ